MAVSRAQVVFPYVTNLPTDVITNTFHFFRPVGVDLPTQADRVTPLLNDFYDTGIYSGTAGMAAYIDETTPYVNWYDLEAPAPRAVYRVDMPLTVTNTLTNIPPEVAIVLSFQGDIVSGEPQARKRGRIFFGGLTPGHIATGGTGLGPMPLIDGSVLSTLASVAEAFRTAVDNGTEYWVVRSETTGGISRVTNGWVDNAPDTQRRRGTNSTQRTLWSE